MVINCSVTDGPRSDHASIEGSGLDPRMALAALAIGLPRTGVLGRAANAAGSRDAALLFCRWPMTPEVPPPRKEQIVSETGESAISGAQARVSRELGDCAIAGHEA